MTTAPRQSCFAQIFSQTREQDLGRKRAVTEQTDATCPSPQHPGLPPLEAEGSGEITLLLSRSKDDPTAAEELLSRVYSELRKIGARKMAAERPGHTLQATDLVHEAWPRLVDEQGRASFQNRAHFFASAGEAMRRILVDRARAKQRIKRGGGAEILNIDSIEVKAPSGKDDEVLAVHDALDALAAEDSRKADVVKLHYFVGMPFEELASVLGISVPTAHRDWAFARAWLHQAIRGNKEQRAAVPKKSATT